MAFRLSAFFLLSFLCLWRLAFCQQMPDLTAIDSRIQRMVDDREKSLQVLREIRFLPQGYECDSVETEKGWVVVYSMRPVEFYAFKCDRLIDISLNYYDEYGDSTARNSMKMMDKVLGPTPNQLPSSQRPFATIFIYPKWGLAFQGTEDNSRFDWVQVFPPTTFRGYKRRLWQDPRKFDHDVEQFQKRSRRNNQN